MGQSAHDPFDSVVLDLIDHSPTGSVPATPAHQDALRRLYASYQVFPSADHKDGHVTVRSLAGQAAFCAANLAQLGTGAIGQEALESNTLIFDRYLRSLRSERQPAAETHRAEVVGRAIHHRTGHVPIGGHDLVHSLILIPGSGPDAGLPGNYLYGYLSEADPNAGAWSVRLRDSSGTCARFQAPNAAAAVSKLQELIESCPFDLRELDAFGFQLI